FKFFFSSRRRHTRSKRDWSSDVCSSDLGGRLILGGTNTYTGSTTILQGALTIGSDAGLGTAPDALIPGHLTLKGGALATTGTFALNANRGLTTVQSLISGNGGTVETISGTLTYNGIITGSGTFTKA